MLVGMRQTVTQPADPKASTPHTCFVKRSCSEPHGVKCKALKLPPSQQTPQAPLPTKDRARCTASGFPQKLLQASIKATGHTWTTKTPTCRQEYNLNPDCTEDYGQTRTHGQPLPIPGICGEGRMYQDSGPNRHWNDLMNGNLHDYPSAKGPSWWTRIFRFLNTSLVCSLSRC